MHLVEGLNNGVQFRDPREGYVVRSSMEGMSCIDKMQKTKSPPPASKSIGDNAPSTSDLNPMNSLPLVHMTDVQSTCKSVGLPTYQPVGASMMRVRVMPKTRNAPAGRKMRIPGPERFAMGSFPDFVGCLVIPTSWG